MAWLTSSSIKEIQVVPVTFDDHDTVIADYLIPFVEKAFKTLSNNPIDISGTTERIYANRTKEIALYRTPITEVISVSLVAGSWASETSSIISSNNYDTYKIGIIKFREPVTGIVEVIYSGGYASGSIPEDIKTACALQIIDLLDQKERLGQSSLGKVGEATSFNDIPFLPIFLETVELYKNPISSREII